MKVLWVDIQPHYSPARGRERVLCWGPRETEQVFKSRNKWWKKKKNFFNHFVQCFQALLATQTDPLCLVYQLTAHRAIQSSAGTNFLNPYLLTWKCSALFKTFTACGDSCNALKSVIEQARLNDKMATSTSDTLSSSLLWKLVSHNQCHAPLGAAWSTGSNKPKWTPPKPPSITNMHVCAEGNKKDVFGLQTSFG